MMHTACCLEEVPYCYSSNLTQIGCFQTVTSVWIHQWQRNDAQSLKKHIRCVLLFFKVIRQISRSHGFKNHQIRPKLGVSGLSLQFEFRNGYGMMHRAWSNIEEVSYLGRGPEGSPPPPEGSPPEGPPPPPHHHTHIPTKLCFSEHSECPQ